MSRLASTAALAAVLPLTALSLTACQQDALTSPHAGRPAAVIAGPIPVGAGPTLTPIVLPSGPVAVQSGGTAVPVSTSFTDYAVDSTSAPYGATLDCGGGSASGVGVTASSPTTGTAGGTCTYTTPGVYTVSLTVTDGAGGSTTQTPPYVVVYDASAGFVTGGGWIISPAGAYVADPSLGGRANFGFVAKYQRGATVPDGQTEFQFQTGRLNFHSTSYEWLVVSGGRAQYKGQGTINGAGSYGFLVTAVDGRVDGSGQDRFRMKIWNDSGAIVYDNQLGQSDTGGAATALAGGAITIHK